MHYKEIKNAGLVMALIREVKIDQKDGLHSGSGVKAVSSDP
jgi:hypothetical protein